MTLGEIQRRNCRRYYHNSLSFAAVRAANRVNRSRRRIIITVDFYHRQNQHDIVTRARGWEISAPAFLHRNQISRFLYAMKISKTVPRRDATSPMKRIVHYQKFLLRYRMSWFSFGYILVIWNVNCKHATRHVMFTSVMSEIKRILRSNFSFFKQIRNLTVALLLSASVATPAIGDYKSCTRIRATRDCTSAKLLRIHRWLRKSTSSLRVSKSGSLLKSYFQKIRSFLLT